MKEQGWLRVVGLGPGPDQWLLPEAASVLAEATDVIGYEPYVARVPERPGLTRHASDNRVELDRAGHAFELALAGKRVVVVSGGDPGVFAMAAAVLEALEAGPQAWRVVDLAIVPGLSAMFAAAARLGAPLGADFCAISLSDNLKSQAIIDKRLKAAAAGDFVMAFYNPASKARPDGIARAFTLLRTLKGGETPVAFARAVGRPDEALHVTTLASADVSLVDMATLVIVGSSQTRLIAHAGGRWMLSPRAYGDGR